MQYVVPAVVENEEISHQVADAVEVSVPRRVLEYYPRHLLLILRYVDLAIELKLDRYRHRVVTEIRHITYLQLKLNRYGHGVVTEIRYIPLYIHL